MPWRPLRAARTTADAPRRAQKGAPKCQRSRDRGGPEAAKPRRSRAICGAVAAVHTPDGGGRAMRPVAWACGGGRARSARARSAQTAHEATRRARRAQCHGALDRGAAVRGEEAGGAVPGAPPARDQKVGASARGRAPCGSGARSLVTAAAVWPRSTSAKVARRAPLLLELRHGQRHAPSVLVAAGAPLLAWTGKNRKKHLRRRPLAAPGSAKTNEIPGSRVPECQYIRFILFAYSCSARDSPGQGYQMYWHFGTLDPGNRDAAAGFWSAGMQPTSFLKVRTRIFF